MIFGKKGLFTFKLIVIIVVVIIFAGVFLYQRRVPNVLPSLPAVGSSGPLKDTQIEQDLQNSEDQLRSLDADFSIY